MTTIDPTRTLLTTADVARQLGVRPAAVRGWIRRGLCDAVHTERDGGRILLHPTAINQLRRPAAERALPSAAAMRLLPVVEQARLLASARGTAVEADDTARYTDAEYAEMARAAAGLTTAPGVWSRVAFELAGLFESVADPRALEAA